MTLAASEHAMHECYRWISIGVGTEPRDTVTNHLNPEKELGEGKGYLGLVIIERIVIDHLFGKLLYTLEWKIDAE